MTFKERAKSLVKDSPLSQIEDMSALVTLADDLAASFPSSVKSDSVSSRQVRVLLAECTAATSRIKRSQTLGSTGDRDKDAVKEAALLRIALVYAAAKNKNNETVQRKLRDFKDCVDVLIGATKSFEDFKILRKFGEAVMAYFKFHGGN